MCSEVVIVPLCYRVIFLCTVDYASSHHLSHICFLGSQIFVTEFPVPFFVIFRFVLLCYSADPLYFQDSYSVNITLNYSISTLSLYISLYAVTLRIYLTSLSPVLAVNYCFNIKIFCIFPTRSICVFNITLSINTSYILKQH